MGIKQITVRGARQHNLKNVDVDIPRDKFTVITGLSGSGKSSLAFDTIYAEGQRRYVESLSAYARQFLDQLEKPDVDSIEGLSPAISISIPEGTPPNGSRLPEIARSIRVDPVDVTKSQSGFVGLNSSEFSSSVEARLLSFSTKNLI